MRKKLQEITVCYKTNPKVFLYNVNGLHVSMRISENSDTMWQYIFGYYMTSEFPILYDTKVSDTIW